MLCIGICDDSYDARFALRSALERLLEPRRQTARILEFSSGEGLLRWQSHHPGELHLVFLDLEMNQLDGMETARRLRQMEPGMQLAFVTGYDSHVYEGYQVGALGYLLKPPKAAQLADILDRATATLTQTNTAFFLCRSGEITYRIPYAEILYFVSDLPAISRDIAGDAVEQRGFPRPRRAHHRHKLSLLHLQGNPLEDFIGGLSHLIGLM